MVTNEYDKRYFPKPTGIKCKRCNEGIFEDAIEACLQPDGSYLCPDCIRDDYNIDRIKRESGLL